MKLALSTLYASYWDQPVESSTPFSGFINFTLNMDKAAAVDYWSRQLDGALRPSFPPALSKGRSQHDMLHKGIQAPSNQPGSFTRATLLRAAWSIVLARYCNTNDVCFGATVSGRNVAVDSLSNMAGPAITTVPVRVRFNRNASVESFLRDVQVQASDMITYEQNGLQNISKISVTPVTFQV